MKSNIIEAIHQQINNEFNSSYAYLAMASWCASKNLDGFAAWMKLQAKEEIEHGMKLYEYLHDRGIKAELRAINKPKADWKNVLDLFQEVCKLEHAQTHAINRLVDLAIEEREHATKTILHWFLEEQVEEEATVQKIKEKLELIQSDPAGILFIDKEMGQRPVGGASH
jgi:ferritin